MKTIALNERTFKLIKDLKEKEMAKSFDSLIINLILKKECVDDSLFGSLKGKAKKFTRKEREEIMGDEARWK